MITHRMSHQEMGAECRKDLSALWNKLSKPKKEAEHKLKAGGRTGKFRIETHLEWESPRGNYWYIALITTKKRSTFTGMVRHLGSDGLWRAVNPNMLGTGPDVHISHHVLHRYAQRFNTNRDVLARFGEFWRDNHMMGMQTTAQLSPTRYELQVSLFHGVAFGEWDTEANTVVLTTFLHHGKLAGLQHTYDDMGEMRRHFMGLSANQRAHALRECEREIEKQRTPDGQLPPDSDKVLALLKGLMGLGGEARK